MSEETTDKKLSLGSGPRTLQLKKTVDTGQVRQSFSHGRSKAVVVERKKKRVFAKSKGEYAEVPGEAGQDLPAQAPGDMPEGQEPGTEDGKSRGRVILRELTDDEKVARAKALDASIQMDREARVQAAEEAKVQASEEARMAREHDEAESRRIEEEARKREEDDARQKSEDEATKRLEAEQAAAAGQQPLSRLDKKRTLELEESEAAARNRRAGGSARPSPARRGEPRRRSGKLTVTRALQEDSERQRSLASVRRAREREKRDRNMAGISEPPKKVVREVVVPEGITVAELANRMAARGNEVIKALMEMGSTTGIDDVIDQDTAELIVEQFGHTIRRVSEADVEVGVKGEVDLDTDLEPRAPVVTVMGHVDHGKTSLLDALRNADVVSGEAGGITQHIGAYQIDGADGQKITPGHEAFTAMRARGANVTDIVVLVVAADDGVKPQTAEAIDHAKAADVPIVVAINKMDLDGADPNRVRQDLLQHELVCEAMGGDILDVEVSATKKTNLDKLEEVILLQSEILELKSNPNRAAEGIVIEARLDKGRGSLATVLVQRGTLKVGDIFVAGSEWGRVRALVDDHGDNVKMAGPSVPVEVLGLQGMPAAGDEFSVVENENRAREVSEFRQRRDRDDASTGSRATLEEMMAQVGAEEKKDVPLVIKADVQGSAEAIVGALENLGTDEVTAQILRSGVGAITESDITLANASSAAVIGFNVRANKQARDLAESEGVDVRYYAVIYDLIDDIKGFMSGLLAPSVEETMLGSVEVREVFGVSKVGKVAGCLVTDGVVRGGANIRIVRDGTVVHQGVMSSLRRFQDEVKEVKQGTECGMAIENFQDFKPGDVIEVFDVKEVARTL